MGDEPLQPSNDDSPIRRAFLDELRDRVAVQDEHSYVSRATRARIGELVLEEEGRPLSTEEMARRLVEQLGPNELAQVLADWLEGQAAI